MMYDWRFFLCYIINNYVIFEGQKEVNVLGVVGILILYIIILIFEVIEVLIKKKIDKKYKFVVKKF